MKTNEMYMDGLCRNYGNQSTGVEDKSQRFKSDFKFEELVIGMDVLFVSLKTTSTITNVTSTTIETFNRTHKKNVDESGKRKGVDSRNWYTFEDFNRTFRRLKT